MDNETAAMAWFNRQGLKGRYRLKIARNEHGSPSGYPFKAQAYHPKHGKGVVDGWSNYKGDTFYVDYEVGHREEYTLDELMPLLKAAIERQGQERLTLPWCKREEVR